MHRPISEAAGGILVLIVCGAAATSCAPAATGMPEPIVRADTATLAIPPLQPSVPDVVPDREEKSALTVALRAAPTGSPAAAPASTNAGPAEVMSTLGTEQLLAQLPPLPAQDTVLFHFPVASPPLPRTGRVVLTSFPAGATRPVPGAPAAALEVVRISPTGEVDMAPHVTVTFSEAMVPLTTVVGIDAGTPPARLTPQPPGRWTWIDTRTLRFQPDSRFPSATRFAVEVAAGTRSASGAALAMTVREEFTTPAVRAVGAYPALDPDVTEREAQRRPWRRDLRARSVPHHPVVLIAFDQRVDPAEVLGSARLTVNGQRQPLRLARAEEIAADTIVRLLARELEQGRWVAVKPRFPLPPDADVRLTLGAGMPSAEGPLMTRQPQELRFRTYGPLRIASDGCTNDMCAAGSPWTILLTNPIDSASWSPDLVRVEPALADMSVHVFGAFIRIDGRPRAGTQYVATLSPSIRDRFGQRLEEPRTVTMKWDAAPAVGIPGAPLIVLDPDGPARVAFRTQGQRELRVRVHRVTPNDWAAWGRALGDLPRQGRLEPPGELVSSTVVHPEGGGAVLSEGVVDVGPALRDGLGHAIVTVETTDTTYEGRDAWRRPRLAFAWVQSTRIGLAASVDAEDMFVWASSLESGEPLAGVELGILGWQPSGGTRLPGPSTAADGTARLALSDTTALALVATAGSDVALLPSNPYASPLGRTWEKRPPGALRWHVMTDRGLYQPGERVHVKGMLRHMQARGAGLRLPDDVNVVRLEMNGPRREDLGSDTLDLGALGGFSTTIDLPEALNLGRASIHLEASSPTLGSAVANHPMQIQEFRRPQYEVRVESDPGPYLVGDTIEAVVSAEYYGGGGLGGADVDWRIESWPGEYTPPGRDGWHFGTLPWTQNDPSPDEVSGVTDGGGGHRLLIDLLGLEQPFATTLRASAQVRDLTRQVGSAFVDLLVHPAALNVGMRVSRGWLHRGDSADVDVIVVDHDGRAIRGHTVHIVLERMNVDSARARFVCSIESGTDSGRCTFTADSSGLHNLRAEVRDDAGRVSRTELPVWVAGHAAPPDPRRAPGAFEVVADRKEYQPGDTARILIQPPFYPAEANVTIRNAGVMSRQRLRIDASAYEMVLPITASHTPGFRVRVDVVDAESGEAHASGEVDVLVPPYVRALDVHVAARDSVATPGGEVTVDVEVRDAAGRPAADAEVMLWMVDESVLALGDYSLRDPLDVLYEPMYTGVFDEHMRAWLLDSTASRDDSRGMDGAGMAAYIPAALALESLVVRGYTAMRARQQTELRTDFAPLAFFEPSLRTDAAGRVRLTARLPESLTRYRIMAVAVAGAKHFGTGDAVVTVRSDLMVRIAAPRFLNYGDHFELPVLVQNATARSVDVEVAARGGGVTIEDAGRRITLAPGARAEVRFDATASAPGDAHVQVIAVSADGRSDAAGVVVPVHTPATVEAFATYGSIESNDPVVLPLARPDDVIEGFGGLDVSITSTALHSLTDAVLYLCTYPFSGAEHIASRVIAVAALRDVLDAFGAPGLPPAEELAASTQDWISELVTRQRGDGGWSFWPAAGLSHPFVSIHVAHALQRAQENGFDVPAQALRNAERYLTAIESHVEEWPLNARQSATAYALYVRHRMGDAAAVQQARTLAAAPPDRVGGELPLEAAGWLLHVLASDPASRAQADGLQRRLLNRLVETAGSATFAESYEEGDHLLLHSQRRTDAVVLEALIAANGDDDVVIRLAQSLLAHRSEGRWWGTQENSWVLLALNRYFRTYEATTPAFESHVWLDDRYAGTHAFAGRTTERQQVGIAMPQLLDADADELVIARTGAGRMYYRAGVRYAPADLNIASIDRGFHVSRVYEGVDDAADVRRDADGTWRIRAGARVRVRLTMTAPSRRYHAALIDPLPAGLEPLNHELSGTGFIDPYRQSARSRAPRGNWWSRWFEHQNLRDDRAEAFASLLPAGVHEYTYIARATTPGTFVVPPPRAEMMYQPETFGRGASATVIIEERDQ